MGTENKEIKNRLSQLRKKMKENGIDYYMIPTADFHNSEYSADYFKTREYFCGFDGSNGTLVVSADEAGLWTDGKRKHVCGQTEDISFRLQTSFQVRALLSLKWEKREFRL